MTIEIVRRLTQAGLTDIPLEMHPVLARIYAARDISSASQLEYGLNRLLPHDRLMGMDQAVALLIEALHQQQRILIVADFDSDGATSCALAMRALRLMGARHVDYLVPNRFEYGYGLSPEIVAVALARRPDLIVTVDNGISSLEGVRAAREAGVRVLVTDHHLAGVHLPQAEAIVNPNQPGDTFPSKALAGVGVIFYVMLALRAALRERNWFASQGMEEPNLGQLLDLVALGTVADVVPLDHNNRILVAQGLARIRRGQCCEGIRAMIEVAGRSLERVVAGDLGFVAGPRLNAAGRLEDMSLGIECLLCDDPARARVMAAELDQLNQARRAIEQDMQSQALDLLGRMRLDDEELPVGLCLYDEDWHQGVIGILASRIKDRVHRPVIAFAPGDDGQLKGSARSVSGVHIRDVLDAVASAHPGLISRFGGHAMAAGLSLKTENLEDFSRAFDEQVRTVLSHDELRGVIYSDGILDPADFTLELAEQLRFAGPWGQGFPEPVFDGEFEILQQRIVGERHLKLLVKSSGHTQPLEAISFNHDLDRPMAGAPRARIAYQLDVNEYRGRRSVQLLVRHFLPLDS